MKLVIDTNRFMAGLLRSSASRQIILHDTFQFFAPDHVLHEIDKYRHYLMEKAHLDDQEFDQLFSLLIQHITLVRFEEFKCRFDDALEIMREVDENDAPFLGIGLKMQADGIWTHDKHFQAQNILKVFSTKDLLQMIDYY